MEQTKTALDRIFGKYPKRIMIGVDVLCFILLLVVANASEPLNDLFRCLYTMVAFVIFFGVLCSLYTLNCLLHANGDQSISPKLMAFSLISILLIICIFFASIYAIIIINDSSAFHGDMFSVLPSSSSCTECTECTDNSFVRAIDLLYFSIVTFTTLGYGDIYPVAWYAKIVVMIESFTFSVVIAFIFMNVKMKENTNTKENTNLTENGETKENGEK